MTSAPRSALRSRATALGLTLLLGGLAACSSAPLPAQELAQGGQPPAGTVVDPETGQTVDAVTGQVVDPVTGQALPAGSGAQGAAGSAAAPGAGSGPGAPGAAGAPAAGAPAAPGAKAPGKAGAPAPPRTRLFTPQQDTIGLTRDTLTMCAHAALSFGKAFNATPEDFNVFWTCLLYTSPSPRDLSTSRMPSSA